MLVVGSAISQGFSLPFLHCMVLRQAESAMIDRWELRSPLDKSVRVITLTLRVQGIGGFWRGFIPKVLLSIPHFYLTRGIKTILYIQKMPRDGFFEWYIARLLSSVMVDSLSTLMIYPIDCAWTIYTCDMHSKHHSLFGCFLSLARAEGLLGLYHGFGTTLASLFLYRAVTILLAYIIFGKFHRTKHPPVGSVGVSLGGQLITYPLEVIRRSQMLAIGSNLSCGEVTSRIVHRSGARELFGGYLVSLVPSFIASVGPLCFDRVASYCLDKFFSILSP